MTDKGRRGAVANYRKIMKASLKPGGANERGLSKVSSTLVKG